MSVSNLERKISFNGDGESLIFNFSFRVLAEGDLTVYIVDESVEPNTLTLQTINTDYVVVLNPSDGGTVTFTEAPSADVSVLLFRETSPEQSLELSTVTRFPSQQIENALDRVTLRQIEIDESIERSITLPENADGVDIQLPIPQDGMQLQWDGETGQLINVEAVDASLLSQVATAAGDVS